MRTGLCVALHCHIVFLTPHLRTVLFGCCDLQVASEWDSGSFKLQPGDEDIHTANERRLKVRQALVCFAWLYWNVYSLSPEDVCSWVGMFFFLLWPQCHCFCQQQWKIAQLVQSALFLFSRVALLIAANRAQRLGIVRSLVRTHSHTHNTVLQIHTGLTYYFKVLK